MARDEVTTPERPGNALTWTPGQSVWDEALATEILELRAISPRSLEWLCDANPHWPSARTIRAWKETRPEFRNAFHLAERHLADVLAYQCLEIADDGSGDAKVIERRDGSTFTILDQEFAARSKLRVETRRWWCSKLAPDVYGDRVAHDHRLNPILSQEDALDQLR